jgi:hypothetical protein
VKKWKKIAIIYASDRFDHRRAAIDRPKCDRQPTLGKRQANKKTRHALSNVPRWRSVLLVISSFQRVVDHREMFFQRR